VKAQPGEKEQRGKGTKEQISFSPLPVFSCSESPIHDCWNNIGVEGNATCRELVKYVHCRNCPVYSAAGMQLLDRPMPAEYRSERAQHYAQEKRITQPARLSVVIFRLAQEWLALPTSVFIEVAERRAMHSLPHRRRGLAMGLVNVRGELLICASLAGLLGMEEVKSQSGKVKNQHLDLRFEIGVLSFDRVLVAQWEGQRIAFPVNEVQGIQRMHQEELKDPPATVAKSTLTYTRGVFGWRERTVGLLETDALFAAMNRSLS
jgi:chemotaxis-related protein WspD